jgi:hypothetical protein
MSFKDFKIPGVNKFLELKQALFKYTVPSLFIVGLLSHSTSPTHTTSDHSPLIV